MKLIAGIQVFNEAFYVRSCLENLYPYFDLLVFCDGAWARTRVLSGASGSTDGTIELIKSFPDPKNKILLLRYSGPNQEAHRQRCLEVAIDYGKKLCKKNEEMFYLLGDADEFFFNKDLKNFKSNLKGIQGDAFRFPWNLYWNDFFTYEMSSSPGRLFRITKGCKANGTCGLEYKDKKRYKPVLSEILIIYHPSYTKPLNRQALKFSYRTTTAKRFPHVLDKGIVYRGNGYPTFDDWYKSLKHGSIEELPEVMRKHYFTHLKWSYEGKVVTGL